MHRAALLDAVRLQIPAVLELLPREDDALLIRRHALLILDGLLQFPDIPQEIDIVQRNRIPVPPLTH